MVVGVVLAARVEGAVSEPRTGLERSPQEELVWLVEIADEKLTWLSGSNKHRSGGYGGGEITITTPICVQPVQWRRRGLCVIMI